MLTLHVKPVEKKLREMRSFFFDFYFKPCYNIIERIEVMNIQEIKKSYEEKLKQLQESLSLLGQYDDNKDVINITSNRLFYQIISGYSVQKYLQGGWIWN